MLGLDALDGSVFDQLCAEGHLPNLAAFRAAATPLGVRSDGETLHGSIWPTFASGTGPGTHGVYFWTQWLGEEQRHVRNHHPAFAFDPFWARFPAEGKRATIVDMPYVPLVEGPGMRAAVGWGLHDEIIPASRPDGFRASLSKRFGVNPLSFDTVEPQGGKEKLAMARRLRLGVKRRAALVEALTAEREWDLFVVTFSEFHMAGHYLAIPQSLSPKTDNLSAMAAIVRPLDEALPRILDAAGPECDVFLFGLHGMRPQVDYAHFGRQIVDLLAGRRPLDTDAHPDLIRRVRNLIPDSLHRAIWTHLPARVRAARQGQLSLGHIDASNEPLFTLVHDSSPAFRLNLQGRERDGKLSLDEGRQRLADLEALVVGFTTDDGQRAFEQLFRSANTWPGERSHRLPDAVAVPRESVLATSSLTAADGTVLHSQRLEARNGVHTSRGFCFVRPGGPFTPLRDTVDTKDFAPSVLQLLGVSAPGSLEGESFVG